MAGRPRVGPQPSESSRIPWLQSVKKSLRVSLINEWTLKKSSKNFHSNVFCTLDSSERGRIQSWHLTGKGFIGLIFRTKVSSYLEVLRRSKRRKRFKGRWGKQQLGDNPLVDSVFRLLFSPVKFCAVHPRPRWFSPGLAWWQGHWRSSHPEGG